MKNGTEPIQDPGSSSAAGGSSSSGENNNFLAFVAQFESEELAKECTSMVGFTVRRANEEVRS